MRLATLAHLAVAAAGCGRIGFEATGDGPPPSTADVLVAPVDGCPVLPVEGPTIRVTTLVELRDAIAMSAPGTTILLADGTYALTTVSPLTINTPVTLRSESGDASKVIIDGTNTATPIIRITAPDVSLISLTIANGVDDGVLFQPADTNPTEVSNGEVYDVTLRDVANAGIRMRPYLNSGTGPFTDHGVFACSRVTTTGSAAVCGSTTSGWGINGDAVRDWVIRDNLIDRSSCTDVGFRTIWFDSGSYDIVVTNNTLLNTNYGIMLGGTTAFRPPPTTVPASCGSSPDMMGGLVCNNIIASPAPPADAGDEDFKEGIALWNACEVWVLHNTVVSPDVSETFSNIEYRYAGSFVHVANNLTRHAILQRDGGQLDSAYAASNVVYTDPSIFVAPASGDVQLTASANVTGGVSVPDSRCPIDRAGRMRSTTDPTPGAFER